MPSAGVHPRRTQKATGSRPTPSLEPPTMSLRKSGTFCSRTGISSELCSPIDNAAFMPKRSPTCPLSLEDLVIKEDDCIAARENDVAKLLKRFDDKLNGHCSDDADTSILNDQNVLAVPRFVLDHQGLAPDPMDIDDKKSAVVNNYHDSDSGIGSSIESNRKEHHSRSSARASVKSISTTHSAVTKSFSSTGSSHNKKGYHLSKDAVQQIERHIVKPILDEPSLKDFHPLIEDIPRRIGAKFISNLRDLEKTLFFLAPIRRYAEIMARTREKKAKGEKLDEMDYSPDEEIALDGGLSKDGRPAELVRKKNGKSISLNPESSRATSGEIMSSKRPFTDDEYDEDDDDALRSMARRRKSDKAGDVMQVCAVCRKEFKRPCDLTKHEKTHSRPWKCSEPKCRYHDMGWPTEKERDRHVNDKHSSTPKMYKCKFSPCTYMSKRESNCKQHMEKAHNWQYVRSKSNGRKKDGSTTDGASNHRTPSTPLTPFIATPASASHNLQTPESVFAPSPWMANESAFNFDARMTPDQSLNGYESGPRRDSMTTAGTAMTFSSGFSPDMGQSALLNNMSPDGNLDFNSPIFGAGGDMDYAFSNAFQQPTPAMSVGADFSTAGDFTFTGPLAVNPSGNFDVSNTTDGVQLSPHGQGDLTLYNPVMETIHADEGFSDMGFGGQDFTLYDTANTTMPANSATFLFPDTNIGTNIGTEARYDHFGFDSSLFPQ